MSKLEKEIISITHFINPHLFWFHKIDACNDDYRSILDIERELAKYYRDHQAWTLAIRRPPINAMVAVKFLAWNKMIRARVDHIAGFGKNVTGGEFIMWAIDYGFPFQTKADQIYRLPEKFTTAINYVRCGGLVNVLPAENFFMRNTMVKRISDKWDQRACELVEKAINDSESIMFLKDYNLNGQEWGELVIKTNMGVKYRVKDHLISLHLAAESDSNFRGECLKLKTNNILPWMCNNGNSKFHTNRAFLYAAVGITHNEIKCPEMECDNVAKQKVEEWYERNQCTSGHEAGLLDTTTECTMTEESVIDSMSIWKYDQLQEADLTKIEEHEENQHMQLAGVLSKSRVEKFVEGKISAPPLPDNIDFDMNAENMRANQTIETTDSEISAIKYVRLEDSIANATDVFSSKKISQVNRRYSPTNVNPWTTTTCTKSSDQTKNESESTTKTKLTFQENLRKFDEVSVISEEIGSFAEYLIALRNQYIESKSGKQSINETTNIIPNEVMPSKESINLKFATLTKSNRSGKLESKELSTTFLGVRMIPAGYDFMNLYDYKDEDHWHCKKSTINDHVPHNEIDLQDFGNHSFNFKDDQY